jgi:hypothetical protein
VRRALPGWPSPRRRGRTALGVLPWSRLRGRTALGVLPRPRRRGRIAAVLPAGAAAAALARAEGLAYHERHLGAVQRPAPPGFRMNLEKVIFGAFVILACTLNFGFFIGELDNPQHHHPMELAATLVVNLIAMTLKFGDRTHIGAVHLATSIVAVVQLVAATVVWVWATQVSNLPSEGEVMATVVSLSGGALLANFISVALLIGETLRRTR